MSATRANGEFPFARGAPVPKILQNFGTESLHRFAYLKSFWLYTILPKVPGEPSGAIGLPFICSNTAEEFVALTSNWRFAVKCSVSPPYTSESRRSLSSAMMRTWVLEEAERESSRGTLAEESMEAADCLEAR